MNETMIKRWNAVVHNDHIVFHLGDFCFGDDEEWNYVIDRLKGKIVLVIGNHDMRNRRKDFMNRFAMVTPQLKIKIEKQKIYLNHFPFLCYAGTYYRFEDAVWQLFGHVHSSEQNKNGLDNQRLSMLFPTQYDVGVDNNNYTPVSFDQVKNIIETQMLSLNMHRGK